jgi:WD40 repeat protein
MFTLCCIRSRSYTWSWWSSSIDCIFIRWIDCCYFSTKWTTTIEFNWYIDKFQFDWFSTNFLGHTKSPRQLIVDSTHHYLYSCSADKKIIVHNFLNGTIIYEYKEFEKAVTNIAMNQQQHLLIASSLDGLIKIFNIQTHELIQQLTTSTSQSIISMIYKNNLVIYNSK